MNFVINIPGDRAIGIVDRLEMDRFSRYVNEGPGNSVTLDVPLHHLEVRHDPDTDKWFAAIVYELLPGSVR